MPQKTEEKSALKAKNMEKMDSDDSEYWLIQEVVENLKAGEGTLCYILSGQFNKTKVLCIHTEFLIFGSIENDWELNLQMIHELFWSEFFKNSDWKNTLLFLYQT